MVASVWPDDLSESLYARGTLQRAVTLAPTKGLFVAAHDGCSAEMKAANDPYGVRLETADATLDTRMLATFIDSL